EIAGLRLDAVPRRSPGLTGRIAVQEIDRRQPGSDDRPIHERDVVGQREGDSPAVAAAEEATTASATAAAAAETAASLAAGLGFVAALLRLGRRRGACL